MLTSVNQWRSLPAQNQKKPDCLFLYSLCSIYRPNETWRCGAGDDSGDDSGDDFDLDEYHARNIWRAHWWRRNWPVFLTPLSLVGDLYDSSSPISISLSNSNDLCQFRNLSSSRAELYMLPNTAEDPRSRKERTNIGYYVFYQEWPNGVFDTCKHLSRHL